MKKRILAVLLVLAMALAPTALAAGTTTRILTKDGPAWIGEQGEGASAVLVYSEDKGKIWNATEGYGGGLGIQDVQYTGREYFMTGFWCKMAYTSPGGKTWSPIPLQDWFEENSRYITNARCSGKYQFLWTGTEYMMRQNIQGDPRTTGSLLDAGPNPRNKQVTLLNEDYSILVAMTFDAQVDAIRYKDGVYYATVGGVEHSFTRADMEKSSFEASGIMWRDFYSDGTVIFQRELNNYSQGRGSCSYDGVTWQTVSAGADGALSMTAGNHSNPIIVSTGRGFFNIFPNASGCRATADGLHWFDVGEKDWIQENAPYWTNISMAGRQTFQFVWTGERYIVCQAVALTRPGTASSSPNNTKVIFLDENYDRVGAYDFKSQVREVGYREGTYYAKVETTDLDSGFLTQTVFTSSDGEAWTKIDLTAIPRYTRSGPAPLAENDLLTSEYALRLGDDGKLLVSDDGVYFAPLDAITPYQAAVPVPYQAKVFGGRDGVLLELQAQGQSDGGMITLLDVRQVAYSNETIEKAIAAALPGPRYYATLDGAYITFDNPPYEKNGRMMVPLRGVSEALGFAVVYDDKGVTCTKGNTVITVEFGTSNATVNGETFTLDAPAEVYRDRTYVPIRFFSEQMGLDVTWNGETGTAVLTTKP